MVKAWLMVKGLKGAGVNIVGREFTTRRRLHHVDHFEGEETQCDFGGMDAVAGPMLRQMGATRHQCQVHGWRRRLHKSELPKLAAGTMADGRGACAEAGGVEGESKKASESEIQKEVQCRGADLCALRLRRCQCDGGGHGQSWLGRIPPNICLCWPRPRVTKA